MKLNDILAAHFNAIGGLARLSEIRNVQRSGDATTDAMEWTTCERIWVALK